MGIVVPNTLLDGYQFASCKSYPYGKNCPDEMRGGVSLSVVRYLTVNHAWALSARKK